MSRVLIIDDSATEVAHLRGILEQAGYDTLAAQSGEEGVSVAKTEMPDVILMDIVMPDLNGFQATRQLSKHDATKNIPVIVVSSKSKQTDRIWAMRQGACEYLTKPADESALVHAVNAVLVA